MLQKKPEKEKVLVGVKTRKGVKAIQKQQKLETEKHTKVIKVRRIR